MAESGVRIRSMTKIQETFAQKKIRAAKITGLLLKMYTRRKTVLTFTNPWECLVAVQLSAQCTDKRVNMVTPALFAKYKTINAYAKAGASAAGIKEFETMIRSTGFYHNKAKNILAAAKLITKNFNNKVPETMAELLTIPGVARKSANVILFNAFNKVEGVAVDTHVKRITKLLGLISKKAENDPVKIEQELLPLLHKKYWALFSLLITEHGREICIANRPRCRDCKLNRLCPSAKI